MNIAIIIAGGVGLRMGGDIPKQYLLVGGKPIILYCVQAFEKHEAIDAIVIVASEEWQAFIREWLDKEHITKFVGFACGGSSRQASILNGLTVACRGEVAPTDVVVVHDAVRPNVSADIITECIVLAKEADGAMPVLPVKDTIYQSGNGKTVDSLLNRDELYAGQAPESFRLGKYYAIHQSLSPQEIDMVRGSSEIAFNYGLDIRLFEGDENNYKITTRVDYDKFVKQVEEEKQRGRVR